MTAVKWTLTAEHDGVSWVWTHDGPMMLLEGTIDGSIELHPRDGMRWARTISGGDQGMPPGTKYLFTQLP